MNQTLYENIKKELSELKDVQAKPKNVSELLGKYLIGKNEDDRLSVLIAFYEYMHKRSEISNDYAFIKTDQSWIEYYKRNISNCFSQDKIRNNITDIMHDKKLTDIILNVCNDDVKKVFYEASNEVIPLFPAEEENLQNINDVKRKDELFTNAASSLGVDANALVKVVGEENVSSIDTIKIEQTLLDELTSKKSIAAKIPNKMFQKLRTRLLMFSLKFNIKDANDLSILEITKKETIFDKIARCPNDVMLSMRKFAVKKKEVLNKIPSYIEGYVKKAIIDTNNKVIEMKNKYVSNQTQTADKLFRFVSDDNSLNEIDQLPARKVA